MSNVFRTFREKVEKILEESNPAWDHVNDREEESNILMKDVSDEDCRAIQEIGKSAEKVEEACEEFLTARE